MSAIIHSRPVVETNEWVEGSAVFLPHSVSSFKPRKTPVPAQRTHYARSVDHTRKKKVWRNSDNGEKLPVLATSFLPKKERTQLTQERVRLELPVIKH